MATLTRTQAQQQQRLESSTVIPPLENGDFLTAAEFMRRYEAMPEVKKAELINGQVYMASPVRIQQHGDPDNILNMWLGSYAWSTKGVRATNNGTVYLAKKDIAQPDGMLRLLPENGGRSKVGKDGYLHGAPELAAEVAASSASKDAHIKRDRYLRAGVREYLLWRTMDGEVDWWTLEEGKYRPLPKDEKGIIRSKVFPGLWLDVEALLAFDGPKLMAILQEGMANANDQGQMPKDK